VTPRVLVNYGLGAAGPRVIAAAASGTCEIVWHCDLADSHARTMIPVLRRFGPVVASAPGSTPGERAEAISSHRPAGITTFADSLVEPTAELAARLQLRYQSARSARAIADKFRQRQALRAAGLQEMSVRTATTRSALIAAVREIGTPVVVKPVHGQGSRHTFRVASPRDTEDLLACIDEAEISTGLIVEEELTGSMGQWGPGIGDYVSVECVTAAGEHQVAGVVGRLTVAPPFRERGAFYPATLDPQTTDAVCALAVRGLEALGVTCGVSHTEVKLTPAGPQILEINGRLGGHVAWLISRHGGPDLVRAALDASLGRSPALAPATVSGVAFRHVPPAPMQVGRATGIEGFSQVRRLPGVEEVEVKVRPGMLVDWREGTNSCLAEISGWARTHAEMIRCTDRVEELLHVRLAASTPATVH
jgi:biotin carboxylase